LAGESLEDLDEARLGAYLDTADIPEPELIIYYPNERRTTHK